MGPDQLLERLISALERNDANDVLSVSDELEALDRLPHGVSAIEAADAQTVIGYWLAERSDVRAEEAHGRALRLLVAMSNPDPLALYEQMEALVKLAIQRNDRALAIFYQRQYAALVRAHEGDSSARLDDVLARLEILLGEVAAERASDDEATKLLKMEAAIVAEQRAATRSQRKRRRSERLELSPQGLGTSKAEAMADKTHHDLFEVLFCTSRRLVPKVDIFQMFPGEAENKGIDFVGHYGSAYVLVPKRREVGQSLLAHRGYKYRPWDGIGPYRYIYDDVDVPNAAWEEQVKQILPRLRQTRPLDRGRRGPEALVYVHGFNTTFDEAMLRAAQLGTDLDIAGPVAAYSWPSAGRRSASGYGDDLLKLDETYYRHLTGLIERVSEVANQLNSDRAKRARVTLIAHSLGARFLSAALDIMAVTEKGPLFTDVVFASPAELTAKALADSLARSAHLAERFTVYTSHSDSALGWRYLRGWLASKPVAGADRVELARFVADRKLNDKVHIVETSAVRNDDYELDGHSDYATSAIDDLRMSVWIANDPSKRRLLLDQIEDQGDARYWQVRNLRSASNRIQTSNPWHLSEKAAVRRALEAIRMHGSPEEALAAYSKGVPESSLSGGETDQQRKWRLTIAEVIQKIDTTLKQPATAG